MEKHSFYITTHIICQKQNKTIRTKTELWRLDRAVPYGRRSHVWLLSLEMCPKCQYIPEFKELVQEKYEIAQ